MRTILLERCVEKLSVKSYACEAYYVTELKVQPFQYRVENIFLNLLKGLVYVKIVQLCV